MGAGATLATLDAALQESIARWGIPGASLALLVGGEIHELVAGVSSTASGLPVTADTLFPYGSVGKVLTATMVLRLLDEGRVELDAPIRYYVPEFRPAQPAHADAITVRRLLSHSSGIVGTIFQDTGWGEDALARNVELINAHPQYFPPGALLSYCNSGLLLLGRLVETVTCQPWHQAFQALLARPLGIDTLVTRPEEALRHRFSVGHVRAPEGGPWRVAPLPFAYASHSPAGSTPGGRARDLLRIVQLYLGDGPHAGFLASSTAEQAWSLQMRSPVSFLQAGWGLGWSLFDWQDGTRIVGHDGATMGSSAFLRIDPRRRVAACLLVNATNGQLVYDEVMQLLFGELCGVQEPGVPASPAGFAPQPERFAAAFEDLVGRLELRCEAGELRLHALPNAANALPGTRWGSTALHHHADDAFYSVGEVSKSLMRIGAERTRLVRPYCICTIEDGTQFFHNGGWAFKRVA